MLETFRRRRDILRINVVSIRRRIAVRWEKRRREKRFNFGDEISERLCRHGNRSGRVVEIDSVQHADNAVALRIDDYAAARARLNRVAVHRGVVERQQTRRCLALVRALKAQQFARVIRFFRIRVNLNLLAGLKLVEAECGAVMVRQRLAQFQDREVAAERVLDRSGRRADVHRGAVIVGAGCQEAIHDRLAIDFRRFGDGGHVIVRGDQPAAWVQAEASAVFAFDTKAEFQF